MHASLSFRQESALYEEVAQRVHPRRKLRTAEGGSEAVSSFLIEVQFRHGARSIQIEEELRGRIGGAAIPGSRHHKGRWKFLQLLTGLRLSRAVDHHQIVGP